MLVEALEDPEVAVEMANLEDLETQEVFHHLKVMLVELVTREPKAEGEEEPAVPEPQPEITVEMVAEESHQILLEAELDFVAEALEAATEDSFLMDHLEAQVVEQEIQMELTDLAEELVETNNLSLAHLQAEVEELY